MGLLSTFSKRYLFLRSKIDAALHGYKIGHNTKIYPGAHIRRTFGGDIKIGRKCIIHNGAMLLSHGGPITIGDNVSVNPYCVLYGQGGLTIGNDVRIAAHTVIVPANHIFEDKSCTIKSQGESKLGVTIGDDVWIGAGVRILDGVTIATGCVIGAGSVVTKSTEPYGVYVGSPAKLVKSRS